MTWLARLIGRLAGAALVLLETLLWVVGLVWAANTILMRILGP